MNHPVPALGSSNLTPSPTCSRNTPLRSIQEYTGREIQQTLWAAHTPNDAKPAPFPENITIRQNIHPKITDTGKQPKRNIWKENKPVREARVLMDAQYSGPSEFSSWLLMQQQEIPNMKGRGEGSE